MPRQSAHARPPHCSSSSAGSASYQGVSGATSPVYHLPQEPYHSTDFGNSYRKKNRADDTILRDQHNYYNLQQKSACCTKESIADTHSYQYFNDRDERKSYGNVDNTFSDDSSYYDYQRTYDRDGNVMKQEKRFPNNVYSEYESDFPVPHHVAPKKPFQKQELRFQSGRGGHHHHHHHNHVGKENNLVVNQENVRGGLDRVYPEAPLTRAITEDFHHGTLPRRGDPGRLSDRGNSPDSSGVGSAIVDGCGGHCVAFENVCSYVLQIFFAMGILIGVSLCIAGTVLRRTKSRDLQVLMYIGAMSAMVCTLLLVVQCRVRRALRKRKRAVRMARAATIPMGDIRPIHQPLIRNDDRAVIVPANVQARPQEIVTEEQGVPWWRRTDLPNNRV